MRIKAKISHKLKVIFSILILVLLAESLFLTFSKKENLNVCDKLQNIADKQQCWEKSIENTLKSKGLEETFNLVNYLYSNEPQFASDCHGFTHLLGEKAYQLFSQNQEIKLSSKTSYCGFGFYHAFMENLLRTTGDLNQAKKFCDYVGQQNNQNELTRLSCFHGVGHGLLEDVPNPNLKGDDQAIIKTPLSICEEVGKNEEEKNRCASGVFNVIALYYGNPKSGLRARDDNPYLICKSQTKTYFQKPCFDQMNTYVLFHLSQAELRKAAEFAEQITQDDWAISAMHGLAGAFGQSRVGKIDYDQAITICKNIQPRLKDICLEGFLIGLFEGGQPGIEYQEGITFCDSLLLDQDEKKICFDLLTWHTGTLHPAQITAICEDLQRKYQYICNPI